MTALEIELLIVVFILLPIAFTYVCNDKVYFNSNVGEWGNFANGTVEFEVKAIKKVYSTSGEPIAEYTLVNSFFAKKNCKGFRYNEYRMYDLPGRYKVGDKLTIGIGVKV